MFIFAFNASAGIPSGLKDFLLFNMVYSTNTSAGCQSAMFRRAGLLGCSPKYSAVFRLLLGGCECVSVLKWFVDSLVFSN